MLRIAICERDKRQRTKLLEYISMDTDIEDDYETECFDKVIEVKQRIDERDFSFDLLFLMLQGSAADSFILADYIRERRFDVDIFFMADTTEHVTEAFRYKAFAYLVKPFDFSKFSYEMKQYLKEKKNYQKEYLPVSVQGKEQMIPLNAVLYFTSDRRKIGAIFFNDDKEVWFYGKLDDLETQLSSYGYIRCHQSYLVNGYRVEDVSGNEIITSDGSFPVSRKYAESVREAWNEICKKIYAGAKISPGGKGHPKASGMENMTESNSTVVLTKKIGAGLKKYGLLVGIRGVERNTSFRLYHDEEVLIGRDSSQAQIVVKSRAVSRKHCGIKFNETEQCYYIFDYSTNGVTVSGIGLLKKGEWIQVPRDSLVRLASEECSFLLA